MSVRYDVEEALELNFSDVQQDNSDSEEEVEDVSEEEDGEEYNPEHDESSSEEEENPEAERETFLSKNGKITWSSAAYNQHGRHAEQNVIKMTPGPTRLLRFDDRESRPARRVTDKLAAIREVWDKWVERLPYLYNPGPDVTVDEQLVPFRGRCPFRQYMPSKPAKYGIKAWVACDTKSSYAWKMQVYTGKPTSGCPEKNQGMRVVLDVTEGLRGHNVTCDNFFTSYELGQQLLKRKITMVGTVRKNKPELPPALLASKEREVFSSKFAFTPMTTVVSYFPKKNKNVVLMSTLHKDSDISDRGDRKPVIILDYNRNKGGVDNLDKVIGTYSCRRMTARWPLVIFHNIIDVSSYNAFVIWREINPTWISHKKNKRRVFLEQLGKALVTPLIERRKHVPRTEASAAVVKAIQSAGAPDEPEDPATTATSPASAMKTGHFDPEDTGCIQKMRTTGGLSQLMLTRQ
ncbi:PiggyBac transposable element-derived protein 4 [Collichthys lucidus]|uniref:PiggyBac transposable element-derived protein 4 n=1 Tax=Collichthys lucidus TaxID=240159 RepID=A0A4U5TUB3_COLLU|nr:PiggyBac transposable element-derived protein 4 [Collichthys lucidus]